MVDAALRSEIKALLDKDSDVLAMTDVVDLCVEAAKDDVCTNGAPLALLEDIFDCSVLAICEKVFDYMQSRQEVRAVAQAEPPTVSFLVLLRCVGVV